MALRKRVIRFGAGVTVSEVVSFGPGGGVAEVGYSGSAKLASETFSGNDREVAIAWFDDQVGKVDVRRLPSDKVAETAGRHSWEK